MSRGAPDGRESHSEEVGRSENRTARRPQGIASNACLPSRGTLARTSPRIASVGGNTLAGKFKNRNRPPKFPDLRPTTSHAAHHLANLVRPKDGVQERCDRKNRQRLCVPPTGALACERGKCFKGGR